MAETDSDRELAGYYDRSTRGMLLLGGRLDTGAMHREVWAPGVRTRREALLYAEELIARELRDSPPEPAALLDLGCGVGATALRLAARFAAATVTGVTLSGLQARLAAERAGRLGLAERCRFIAGSFLELERLLPAGRSYRLAWAVESFIHAADPAAFFAGAAGRLEPKGGLVIIDDFLSPASPAAGTERARWLERFRRGWRVGSLLEPSAAAGLAREAGLELVSDLDLSGWLRRSPAWLLGPAARLAESLPGLPGARNLLGDAALQVCLASGWTSYRCLRFRRPERGAGR